MSEQGFKCPQCGIVLRTQKEHEGIVHKMEGSWCLASIAGNEIKVRIMHLGRGKFKILEDRDNGKYVGRIIDASEVTHCQFRPSKIEKDIVTSSSSQITINASTQTNSVEIGNAVAISGSVKPVITEQPVVVQVFDPNGVALRFDEIALDASGSFTYTFKLDGQLPTGNYRFDVGYFNSKKSLTLNAKRDLSVTTSKISISETGLVDAFGSTVSEELIDKQALVQSKVSNNQDTLQEYAYVVQIKDSADTVVSLSWVQGSLNPRQSLNVAQSWRPSSPGKYKVQIFVWESIANPIPLTPTGTLEIEVQE